MKRLIKTKNMHQSQKNEEERKDTTIVRAPSPNSLELVYDFYFSYVNDFYVFSAFIY